MTYRTENELIGFKSIQWDATDSMGRPVSTGVYLYQIQAEEFVQTKKMVLLKYPPPFFFVNKWDWGKSKRLLFVG
tara:strand:- start:427 stop:651 length:225 start_codon:yes stop_codon:yes gene_type:complete